MREMEGKHKIREGERDRMKEWGERERQRERGEREGESERRGDTHNREMKSDSKPTLLCSPKHMTTRPDTFSFRQRSNPCFSVCVCVFV